MTSYRYLNKISTLLIAILIILPMTINAGPALNRKVAPKPVYDQLPVYLDTDNITLKLVEGIARPEADGNTFIGADFAALNQVLGQQPVIGLTDHFKISVDVLDKVRSEGVSRSGTALPDLSLYFDIAIDPTTSASEKLALIEQINSLEIVEIAFFQPIPELPIANVSTVPTPDWEHRENYLSPAPRGLDAYYGWSYEGGHGEGIKVVDIEGNWVEHHEDLRGGTSTFHIAGTKIDDPTWYNHGTAVLGEIAADSNWFGMTGMAYNVDLGTVSVGSMNLAQALVIATDNTVPGDIILIELQTSGPNGGAYVPMEYYQDNFDAILVSSAAGRIVVEAGANGSQNLDDPVYYGSLFDPEVRFSGAIMVGAADTTHWPSWFTSYGQRVDVHGFGSDVYTLGYGGLWGSDTTTYYTATFGGTSSASPMIVGACAILQGIYKATYEGAVMDHNVMRDLLKAYSTPQLNPSENIGPMPDLRGSVESIYGVSFSADTTFGWAPLSVDFTGNSGLAVDSWTWSFGDGDSAFVQNPSHTYVDGGMFDVSLEVTVGADHRISTKNGYMIVLADTMFAENTGGSAGDTVEVGIYARNNLPISLFEIPIAFSGPVDLAIVPTVSVEGCRTDYFQSATFIHYNPSSNQATVKLQAATSSSLPPLQPGYGLIAKLKFVIALTGSPGLRTELVLDGYSSYEPRFQSTLIDYQPVTEDGSVTVCVERGNVNLQPGVDVSDLTWLVDYLFAGGPPPLPMAAGDVDCEGSVNVTDLTYMVDFLFGGGPPPCDC